MGQGEVIKILEKADKPLTSREISERLLINWKSVSRILKSLMKDCTVNLKFRQLTFDEKKLRYGKVVNPTLIRIYWLE